MQVLGMVISHSGTIKVKLYNAIGFYVTIERISFSEARIGNVAYKKHHASYIYNKQIEINRLQ